MDEIVFPDFIKDEEMDISSSSLTGASIAFAIIDSKKDIPIFYPEIEEEHS